MISESHPCSSAHLSRHVSRDGASSVGRRTARGVRRSSARRAQPPRARISSCCSAAGLRRGSRRVAPRVRARRSIRSGRGPRSQTSRRGLACPRSSSRTRELRSLLLASHAMIFDDHDVHDDWNASVVARRHRPPRRRPRHHRRATCARPNSRRRRVDARPRTASFSACASQRFSIRHGAEATATRSRSTSRHVLLPDRARVLARLAGWTSTVPTVTFVGPVLAVSAAARCRAAALLSFVVVVEAVSAPGSRTPSGLLAPLQALRTCSTHFHERRPRASPSSHGPSRSSAAFSQRHAARHRSRPRTTSTPSDRRLPARLRMPLLLDRAPPPRAALSARDCDHGRRRQADRRRRSRCSHQDKTQQALQPHCPRPASTPSRTPDRAVAQDRP